MNRRQRLTVLVLGLFWSLPLWAAEHAATLQWLQRVELGTPVSGVVNEVAVRPGQRVKQGALLLRLDPRAQQAAVRRAEAEAAGLKVRLDEAERELARTQELYDRTLLAEHDLQVAQIEFSTSQALYQGAQAELVQARLALEYTTLRAPFDAVVLARQAEVGQTVVSELQSTPLIVVAAAGRMLAVSELEPAVLARLEPGGAATVRVAGQEYQGRIHSIGFEPAAGTSRYRVAVEFETAGRLLRAGSEARVSLP